MSIQFGPLSRVQPVQGDCLRCERPIEGHDVALACGDCRQRYHHDCFIPGARCAAAECWGTVEFQKSEARCTRADCRRAPSRMGWAWLGPGARSLCHDHAADLRLSEAYGVVGLLGFMAAYFVLRAWGRGNLEAALHNAWSLELLLGVVAMFLGVAAAFGADAYRIRRADPLG